MTASSTTPNYDLPIFADDDKPTWRGDVNSTNTAIDAALKGLSDKVSSAPTSDTTVAGFVANDTSETNKAIDTLLASGKYVIVKVTGGGLTAAQLDGLSL